MIDIVKVISEILMRKMEDGRVVLEIFELNLTIKLEPPALRKKKSHGFLVQFCTIFSKIFFKDKESLRNHKFL